MLVLKRQVDLIVTSPPYGIVAMSREGARHKEGKDMFVNEIAVHNILYSDDEDNLGNLKYD